jgi:hypothetical protein
VQRLSGSSADGHILVPGNRTVKDLEHGVAHLVAVGSKVERKPMISPSESRMARPRTAVDVCGVAIWLSDPNKHFTISTQSAAHGNRWFEALRTKFAGGISSNMARHQR